MILYKIYYYNVSNNFEKFLQFLHSLLLFSEAAKERAPAVIFIDEIDSVGAKRTNSSLHPYANQTVNQLLTEMDG